MATHAITSPLASLGSSPASHHGRKRKSEVMNEPRRVSFGDTTTSGMDSGEECELATDRIHHCDTPEEEEDDDDSIEFLLTINPPSPKKGPSPGSKPPPEVLTNPKLPVEDFSTNAAVDTGFLNEDIAQLHDHTTNSIFLGDGEAGVVVAQLHTSDCNDECCMDKENFLEGKVLVKDGLVDSTPLKNTQATYSSRGHDNPEAEHGESDPRQAENSPSQTGVQLKESTDGGVSVGRAPYTFLTSAYVQNLAEICHTIINDRRWRVGADQKRLLSWEQGDDLSAVIPLARRFRPFPPLKSKTQSRTCLGLLCDCKSKDQGHAQDETIEPEDIGNPRNDVLEYSLGDEDQSQDLTSIEDAADDRRFHLYCRLFYRRGPWFRLDDFYFKYYAPKPTSRSNPLKTPAGSAERQPSKHTPGYQPSAKKGKVSPPTTTLKTFFTPKASAKKKVGSKESTSKDSVINEEIFQRQVEALETCLADVKRLQEMGLVRTFADEVECGKTVGESKGPLTAPERQQLLASLGGHKSGKSQSKKRRLSRNESTSSQESGSSTENEIWNQMCRQKSISAQFTIAGEKKDSASAQVLPVTPHVNNLVFDKLAARIVQACSHFDSVATPVVNARKATIKLCIVRASNNPTTNALLSGNQLDSILGKFPTCIRLREEPHRALLRICRLFLCATSGPGQMRSDGGTNGWKSMLELDQNTISENTFKHSSWTFKVEPPGLQTWGTVTFPGLQHRFGLATYSFTNAFQHLPLTSTDSPENVTVQVFDSSEAFRCWEMSAEFRSHADFLIETNELLLSNERKRAREEDSSSGEKEEEVASTENEGGLDSQEDTTGESGGPQPRTESAMDMLKFLSPSRRKFMFRSLLSSFNVTGADELILQLESDVSILYSRGTCKLTECEEILSIMGLVILHFLTHRIATISEREIIFAVSKPWLRHLSCEACLAYILWDIIPILERRGFKDLAIRSLMLLVYGRSQSSRELNEAITAAIDTGSFPDLRLTDDDKLKEAFAHFLLSRRARGKGLERVVIDLKHLISQSEKARESHTKSKKKKTISVTGPVEKKFAHASLNHVVETAAVSFSSIRAMAKRLKQPLAISLKTMPSPEANLLGIRLHNDPELLARSISHKKYSDWDPITDTETANAMSTDGSIVGRRCSFVGHEDNEEKVGYRGSMNVEQLAMECYGSGRLPAADREPVDSCTGGHWVGWHDEGGLLRALFRVLCFEILDMDWKLCSQKDIDEHRNTIHISPYQGAPFDLHVGCELADSYGTVKPNRGFYLRHEKKIEAMLEKLGQLSRQEVGDLVWHSIAARREFMVKLRRKDPSLERDILQCRTLSLVAAGFGGPMLKNAFRLFLFDYRHYSGGLPDLLLVRAKYAKDQSFVDLGNWVGEAFDAEYLANLEQEKRMSLLGDRDDDFLGCGKMGDSGTANARNRFGRQSRPLKTADTVVKHDTNIPELPPKLELFHCDSPVEVECMFVEVKSANDKLDARQEDWLNVLDRSGNARVCKFTDMRKPQNNKKRKS